MNNLYKLFAFLCLVLVTNSMNAQTSRPAFVTGDGQIILDASNKEIAEEYVADISTLNLGNLQQANFYFQKYIDRTTGRGMDYFFDFTNKKMIIRTTMANQYLVPLSHGQQVNVTHFNEVLRMIHLGLM